MNIESIHKVTRIMDFVAVIFMACWFVWGVINGESKTILLLIGLGCVFNIYMLKKQPAKKLTNYMLSGLVKKGR